MEQLAAWLKQSEPALKGFDKRALYRMKEFYLTWQSLDWDILKNEARVVGLVNPQLQEQADKTSIVGSANPQLPEIPPLLTKVSWTHHIEILKRTSSMEEKVFYLLLAIKDRYTVAELIRQMLMCVLKAAILMPGGVAR